MSATPEWRFLQEIRPDPRGLVDAQTLSVELPYGLQPWHILRTVEDVQELIQQLNLVLHESSYEPLEDLLDRASFSGLISRTVATRLAAASQILVVNQFHNGYPDLIGSGEYPHDAVQRGVGIEVKASRSEGSWQSHGPRPGWLIVVQFGIDERTDVARLDRNPTRILAAMLARLSEDDWSWTPARSGRIRSGTASVTSSGKLKLREGAVWVEPEYRSRHEQLISSLRLSEVRRVLPDRIVEIMTGVPGVVTVHDLAEMLAPRFAVSSDELRGAIRNAVSKLRRNGQVLAGPKRGTYRVVVDECSTEQP